MAVRFWLALVLCLGAGCTHGVTVRGAVVQPARVPARAFPRILVTSTGEPDSDALADAIASHLRPSRSTVRRVTADEVDGLRARARIARATIVIQVQVALSSRDRPEWARRRMLTCGPIGCVDRQRPYVRDVPWIIGRADLQVLHGPTGRVLQREQVRDEESGLDDVGARLRVLERLAERIRGLLDQRTEEVHVELLDVDDPAVRPALEAIRDGRWRAGRLRLERLTRSRRFQRLPPEQRARVLYDLGQARRFDVTLPADERFSLASEALRAAVRLAPQPRYANALADLDAHRRARRLVREQRDARAHNFALLALPPGQTIPAPPDSYR